MEDIVYNRYEFTTLITTIDYACGIVCLAQSLLLVKSIGTLKCYVTTEDVSNAIHSEALRSPGYLPKNLIIKLLPKDVYDIHFQIDIKKHPSLFIDAPRRAIFKIGNPFIFLDADMIAIQNFDELFEYLPTTIELDTYNNDITNKNEVFAVPNFRNKKKNYNNDKGNFNAGMMIVPHPCIDDYIIMEDILNKGYNDTEEKLLNEVFTGRWRSLEIKYNCQKRCFKLAPDIWNSQLNLNGGIKIVHYVGGKPWQDDDTIARLDWEGSKDSMKVYEPLMNIWHLIRNNNVNFMTDNINNNMTDDKFSLLNFVPLAII